jgi:hypothetical protein
LAKDAKLMAPAVFSPPFDHRQKRQTSGQNRNWHGPCKPCWAWKFNTFKGSSKMANFTKLNRVATAAVGAIVISTACVAAATGPAFAVKPNAAFAAVEAPASGQARA